MQHEQKRSKGKASNLVNGKRKNLIAKVFHYQWWGRGESNPYDFSLEPESSASTNSATAPTRYLFYSFPRSLSTFLRKKREKGTEEAEDASQESLLFLLLLVQS